MIRSTVNATNMTMRRSGMTSESIELVYGDNGTFTGTHEYTEAQYDALVDATLGPLHSKEHWDSEFTIRS